MTQVALQQELDALVRSSDNHCFVCGPGNPHGLQLQFETHGDVVSARFIAQEWQQGWNGVIHGGLLATVMDEAMAYCLYFRGVLGYTARMQSRFRSQVREHDQLTAEAWLERDHIRFADIQARLCRGETLVAEASARFMKVGKLTREILVNPPRGRS